MPVTVAKPLVKQITDWDEYTGRFEAVERVDVRARVSGFLESIHFREGQMVEKGEVLFIIDPRPFQAEMDAAKAAVESAETAFDLAVLELKRAESLVLRNNIARETVDQRRAARETARAEILSAKARVRSAELNLEFTQVRAPFKGRVSDARIDVGNLVEGGSAQSTLLTTLLSTDPILFTFTASEAEFLKYTRLDLSGLRQSSREKSNPVYVRLADETDWSREGQMYFVDNELSPETGTMRGKAIFDNPDGILTPGVFGRLRLVGSAPYDAILIPDDAVVSDQSQKMVLIVGDDATVTAKPVTLGPRHNGLRVVRSGLGADDVVIVRGVQRARPGGKVVPQNAKLQPDGTVKQAPES
jgi:RND family efflux transporter MFP subunit